MKILVLGKTGMLGHVVFNYLIEKKHEVYGTTTTGEGIIYDAYKNMEQLESIIIDIKPAAVINCIGILNKNAEENHALAVKLNSLLPHYIDMLSEKYNFKFVHVSTDCVFDGTKGKYDEKSLPDSTSFYGRSKALGEVINRRSVTLRTSIVGPDSNPNGIGLFQWFMNQKEKTEGYNKVIWTGVTTIELAKIILISIEKNICGLNHVVNNDFISKYDLLKLFKKEFKKEITIEKDDTIVSEKTLIRTKESYPFEVSSYATMIKNMKDWIINHKDLYSNIIKQSGLEK